MFVIYCLQGKSEHIKAAYPLRRDAKPSRYHALLGTKERRAMLMITYQDLIEFSMFIIALVGLCYTIFGGKK